MDLGALFSREWGIMDQSRLLPMVGGSQIGRQNVCNLYVLALNKSSPYLRKGLILKSLSGESNPRPADYESTALTN